MLRDTVLRLIVFAIGFTTASAVQDHLHDELRAPSIDVPAAVALP